MLDRYWHGDTFRISPEAPIPVVNIAHHEERAGGAANVALNIKGLGAKATLITRMSFQDDAGQKLKGILDEAGVNIKNIALPADIPTTLKLRVVGRSQQLLRMDFEHKIPCSAELILRELANISHRINLIILSDYAKGVLDDPKPIIEFATQHQIKILVDPKKDNSYCYQNATLLTPNFAEFESMMGKCIDEETLANKAQEFIHSHHLQSLLITRGAQGMSYFRKNEMPWHVETKAKEVFDVSGAGDTVISVLGTAIAAGFDELEAVKLANYAAGLVVGKLGTATVSVTELEAFSDETIMQHGIVSLPQLQKILKNHRRHQEKIVMTNGCFDILHVGHIQYLQAAKNLGNYLIIAVNTDDSIKRLKGESRPINPLEARMQTLAALRCVDYVISFSDDTPLELIKQILPDFLVKGGDWSIQQIVGAKEVMENGGQVQSLPFVDGFSTTRTLEKLLSRSEIA